MDGYERWERYLGWFVAEALEREGYPLHRATGPAEPEQISSPRRWSRLRDLLAHARPGGGPLH